jgi:hypothetical protein
MGSDRYLLKQFGLLGRLFGRKGGKEPPASQPAEEQPPAAQPVGRQDLVEAIRKLSTETLKEAYAEAGYPTVSLGPWQELQSLLNVSIEGAIKAAQEGKYDEMCNYLEDLKSKLEEIASPPRANSGLVKVVQLITERINKLIKEARGRNPSQ